MDLLSTLGAPAEVVTVGYPGGIPDLDLREAPVPSGDAGRVVVDVARSAARFRVAYPKPPPSRTGALSRNVVRATLAGQRTVTQVTVGDVSALRLS